MRELKKCKKQIKEIENENDSYKKKNEELQKQISALTNNLISNKFDKVITKYNAYYIIFLFNYFKIWKNELDSDDLDISIAVVQSEPNISQLYEDLETIEKEKDKLAYSNLLAEEKVISVSNNGYNYNITDYYLKIIYSNN